MDAAYSKPRATEPLIPWCRPVSLAGHTQATRAIRIPCRAIASKCSSQQQQKYQSKQATNKSIANEKPNGRIWKDPLRNEKECLLFAISCAAYRLCGRTIFPSDTQYPFPSFFFVVHPIAQLVAVGGLEIFISFAKPFQNT